MLHQELYPSEHLSLRHVSGEGTPATGENMLKPPQFDCVIILYVHAKYLYFSKRQVC